MVGTRNRFGIFELWVGVARETLLISKARVFLLRVGGSLISISDPVVSASISTWFAVAFLVYRSGDCIDFDSDFDAFLGEEAFGSEISVGFGDVGL